MKLSDYIKPMSEFPVDEVVDGNFTDRLIREKVLPTELRNYMSDTLVNIFENYANLGYRIIPMDISSNIQENAVKLCNAYYTTFTTKFIFTQIKLEDGVPVFKDLNSYGVVDTSTDGTDSGSTSNTKTYGKIIEKEDKKNEFGMTENSPINAIEGEINSPSLKNKYTTSNNFTDTHSGSDSDSGEFENTSSSSNNKTEKTVDNYEKYIEFIERYNIRKLVDDTIRMYIWEFNSVR